MSDQAAAVIRPRIHSANKRPLQDILPLKTPISAHIDVSSVCNYKCSFCFQADMEGMKKVGLKRGFMSVDMFKKIVDDCAAFPEKIKKINAFINSNYKKCKRCKHSLTLNAITM